MKKYNINGKDYYIKNEIVLPTNFDEDSLYIKLRTYSIYRFMSNEKGWINFININNSRNIMSVNADNRFAWTEIRKVFSINAIRSKKIKKLL